MTLINIGVAAVKICTSWRKRRRANHELMAFERPLARRYWPLRTDIPNGAFHGSVVSQGAAAVLSAILAKALFCRPGLSPIWPIR